MKQTMQPRECPDTFRRIRLAFQQGHQIDATEFGQQMRKADEAAEQAVAVESVGEVDMPRATEQIAVVPEGAGLRIEQEPQPFPVQRVIVRRGAFTEELPEFLIAGEGAKARELELQQRKMRPVQVDSENLRRTCGKIGQRITTTG